MTKIFATITLLLSLAIISCSNNDKKDTKEEIKVETPIVKEEAPKPTFERLPVALLQKFFNECNSIDVTFYNSNKTINLWDDNVKHVLSMITDEAPVTLDDNIIGHIMMLKDGEQLAFVEVSLNGTNNYVIYNIDDKKYYNKINEKGLEFFAKFSNKDNE